MISGSNHGLTLIAAMVCAHLTSGGMPIRASDWNEIPGGRYRDLHVPAGEGVGFRRLDPTRLNLAHTNVIAQDRYVTNQIYLNGSGVALGDVDGDGRCDLYFCGLDSDNALFRNLGGWQFTNVTAQAGVACPKLDATGCLFLDLDGDGDLDLVVNSVGQGTRLFLQEQSGAFVALPPGPVNLGRSGTSAAAADFDGDGDLDLYVANYRADTIRDMPNVRLQGQDINGRQVINRIDGRPLPEIDVGGRFEISPSGRIIENGQPDVLFRNDGQGRLVPLSFTNGVFLDPSGRPLTAPPFDWGLSVMFRDLNGDGLPDLYVSNDFESPDRIWINQGDGRFRAIDPLAIRHTSIFSMGMDAGDLNRDGYDDLFISDMLMQEHGSRQLRIGDVPPVPYLPGVFNDRPQYSFNTFQLNRGDHTYAEISWFAGTEASGWTWCPVLLDVDLDGYEDLLFTTGHQWDMMNGDVIENAEVVKARQSLSRLELLRLRCMFARFATPKVVFRNQGNLHFQDCSAPWGFTEPAVSQGVALGDLDGDGDLDLAFNNLNEPASLFENISSAPRVAVRLKGLPPNTRGIGARIRLRGGAVAEQSQVMTCGGHYLSGDDTLRVFAAGSLTNRMQLDVDWPSGRQTRLAEVRPNRIYEIDEPPGAPSRREPPPPKQPWFEDVSSLIAHRHHDEPFDEFARQPLLPFALSALGPGVAWGDLNDDGWDDLVVGAGKGGVIQAFQNDHGARFVPLNEPFLTRPVRRDLTGIVIAEGTIMCGSSNYEDGTTNGGCIRLYDMRRKAAGDAVLGPRAGTGPIALGDLDGDGDLDLFVGGRAVAGRYPEPAESVVLRNDGGRFSPLVRWEKLGLVSGAVFSDLDGDGWPDLVLACDWGPIRVFHNERGTSLREVTQALGLSAYTGWWRGVTTGDFDADGRLDIVASNWGGNSRYQATAQHPARVRYGDLDDDQVIEVIESRVDPATGRELPTRGLRMVGLALPWLRERIGTYEAYGKATLTEFYGDRLSPLPVLDAATLASTVFLNRGDHFEPRPLPPEAQWTTAFAICVADADGDGHDDLFLSQNFFGVPADNVRQDAGRGLWLLGDGQGGFRAVPGQESGVRVYGEQRGAAVADFDADGRIDLVVAQNGNPTLLFRNVHARPGLRIRLEGPNGNRQGMGAVLRLGTAQRWGAAREIHAGSGYWSQDSPVTVLTSTEPPTRLEVRWPGGIQTRSDLPAGAQEVIVNINGTLRVVR